MNTPIRYAALAAIAGSCLCFSFTAAPVRADAAMEAWGSKAAQDFASRQRYPRAAIEGKEEGVVKVQVNVVADGHITGFSILESSGHASLDNEVLALLNRVNPLPPLPAGHDSYSINIPLRYKFEAGTELEAGAEVDSGEDMWKAWGRSVSRAVASRQAYPTELLGSKVEGRVKLQLTVAPDGSIIGQKLAQSSGNEALDAEAMNMVRDMSLPPLPEGDDAVTISVPLTYKVRQK